MTAPDLSPDDLGAIQARVDAAEWAKVAANGDSHTRDYVRALESVASDVPALLALVREQQARIQRVRSMLATWEKTSQDFGLGDQNISVNFAVTRIRAALTATEGAE